MSKDYTKQEYSQLVKEKSPNSHLLKNLLMAYLVGGLICVLGQGINYFYQHLSLTKEQTSGATAVTLVFLGAFFTGLNVYDKLAKHAGAGTLVPITGFANSIVAPALEFKSEGFILGMSAKMFTIAGPVLVFGILSSIAYGIIYIIFVR